MEQSEVDDLVAKLREPGAGVEVRDRKWMLRSYPQCFVGRELVTWLVQKGYCEAREDAVALGNALLLRGVIS